MARFPMDIALEYFKRLEDIVNNIHQDTMKEMEHEIRYYYNKAKADSAMDNIDDMLDNLRTVHQIPEEGAEKIANDAIKKTRKFSIKQVDSQIESIAGVKPNRRNPKMSNTMQAHLKENVKLIKSVPEKYHDEVERVIHKGVVEGRSYSEIEKAIGYASKKTTDNARLIARDQVGNVMAAVTKERQTQVGVEHYIWRTIGDNRVRDSHQDLDGERFSWKEGSPEGHPGQPIQCRCIAEPDREEVLNNFGEKGEPSPTSEGIGSRPNPKNQLGEIEATPEELKNESERYEKIFSNNFDSDLDQAQKIIDAQLLESDEYLRGLYNVEDNSELIDFDISRALKGSITAEDVNKMSFDDIMVLAKEQGVWKEIREEQIKGDLSQRFVKQNISTWAGTSADTNPRAIMMQLTAKEEFGLDGSLVKHLSDSAIRNAKDQFGKAKPAFKEFLRAQYNYTQEYLEKEGIEKITAYRAMNFRTSTLPDLYKRLNFKEAVKARNQAGLQPMSYFTTSPSSMNAFLRGIGGEDVHNLVVATDVPADRILSLNNTGMGTRYEQELVVLGSPSSSYDKTALLPFHPSEAGESRRFEMSDFFNVFGR